MAETAEAEAARLRAEVARLERRVAELELLADRDPLLPVLNRRAFVRELGRALAFQRRYGGFGALLALDLDGLKAINDGLGHAAGDLALAMVAQTLADNVRESDLVGRLGGDEFAVLLSQAPLAEARLKAEALSAQLRAAVVAHEGRRVPVTASFGVRALDPALTAAELLAEADAAMYVAKAAR